MNTKQKILYEALSLFSVKGYSAVNVGEIAEAVGIKTPSLYKHYKSKQDIFNFCVVEFSKRIETMHNDMRLPESKKAAFAYDSISTEKLIDVTTGLFLFYLQDDVASKFRKMLQIERYHNSEINAVYEDLFIEGSIKHEEEIFTELINKGVIKGNNAHVLALRFYTPIFFLLQKYDMNHDQIEDAKRELALMVQDFRDTYVNAEN
ncbi:hypothetical protein AOC36_00240 [Erysipelothrix larvae]|uniref:HTH tetR-type domain-containing protein n=1 Tax=Erysipelothrix larvae TaxID=1514105 RepID=A0A120JTC4_9FIRM|nr:TetR/AcrR family transcriptional regulator [Erysipelothrix larvae]AMC92475.1 hypothetical protein AOC36_00240 [Erysipelothrix larvae]